MASFTWSDTFRACLPCLRSPSSYDGPNLQSLLAEAGTNSDADAETLSLHSQLGNRRRVRQRPSKGLNFMGWDLFGRRRGAIALPEDDDTAAGPPPQRTRTISATSDSQLDPDAAPLDTDAIARLTDAELAAAAKEAERRAKEERRAKRRERRERKRASLAQDAQGAPFEGFQDDSAPYMDRPSPYADYTAPELENYGHGTRPMPQRYTDDDDGDFDGSAYTRPPRSATSAGGRSETNSRSSASGEPSAYNHHHLSRYDTPTVPSVPEVPSSKPRKHKSKPARSSKAGTSRSSASMSTTQESAPLASPRDGAFHPPSLQVVLPSSGNDFEGFPGGNPGLADSHAFEGFPTSSLTPTESFPSARLGGGRKGSRADAGVALAWRGQ